MLTSDCTGCAIDDHYLLARNDLISAAKMPSFLLLLFLVSGVMGSVFSGGGSPNDNEDSSGEAPILDRPVIAYPVSNIRFDSVLDQRLGYFGNAVLTISWEHPEDSHYLNDYIIEAQSIYGCTYQNYTSESINKSATSHIVIAAAPGDFPLYNCDYSVNVFSRFEQRESNSTQLFLRRDDKIQGLKLYCMQSQWSEVSYKFSYKLEWTLPFYTTLDENIERFLIDLRTYPFGKVERTNFVVNKTTYVYEWNDLPPCSEDYHFIAFTYWSKHLRFVRPYMEAECFVDATSPSPSKICNISVISYSWDSHLSLLHVDLSWDPPAVVNGVLSGYNVSIATRPLKDQDDNFPLLGYIWDSTNSTASIDVDFTGLGQSDLVLQIRAWNKYVPGNWSGGLILPITGSRKTFISGWQACSPVLTTVIDPTDTTVINPTDTTVINPTDTTVINPTDTTVNNVALSVGLISGCVAAVAAVMVIMIITFIKCKIYKRKKRFIEDPNLDSMFVCGPKKPQYKSAEYSPLQSDEWEIHPQQVIVDECLGEGAFGEVYKGFVKGSLSNPKAQFLLKNICTTVAIKLLKSSARGSERSDFLKEIETMKKVAEGQNPHVVGLVGCVTTQEPLCLITEFVEYGDLLSYLRTSRKQARYGLLISTENPYLNLGTIAADDLTSFAYQIASGMEFLSSLGVVHRDLACRNVLVGEGKVLKITDFGMSREIDEVYVQKSKGRVPLKWMAIESIVEREFTTASDVWAYGVTLWEISTMGGFPYPSILNENLLPKLQKGYRMEKPDNCGPEIYQVMLECWSEHPKGRPSFAQIRAKFDTMLMASKKDAYIDLQFDFDQPYYRMDPDDPSSLQVPPLDKHQSRTSLDSKQLGSMSLKSLATPLSTPLASRRASIQKAIMSLSHSSSSSSTHGKAWRPSSMTIPDKTQMENKYVAEPFMLGAKSLVECPYTRRASEGNISHSDRGSTPTQPPMRITVTEEL